MKTKIEEELEREMICLIKETANMENSFIFERLQDFMEFKDGKATWTNNVKLRMLELDEAKLEGYKLGLKDKEEEFEKFIEKLKEEINNLYGCPKKKVMEIIDRLKGEMGK